MKKTVYEVRLELEDPPYFRIYEECNTFEEAKTFLKYKISSRYTLHFYILPVEKEVKEPLKLEFKGRAFLTQDCGCAIATRCFNIPILELPFEHSQLENKKFKITMEEIVE